MITITVAGRIGRDAETRYLPNGNAVTDVAVAGDSGFGNNKKTIWFKCAIWGKQGEGVAPYLKKGGKVTVSGELGEDAWTNQQGVEQKTLTINVDRLDLGANPNAQASQQQGQQAQQQRPAPQQQQPVQQQPQQQTAVENNFDVDDDSIPF